MIKDLRRILFPITVFLIPVNLGKHFIIIESYVLSRLVDYLVPTIWLIDILILVLLILWILDGGLKDINKTALRMVIIFAAAFLPSVFVSQRFEPSVYFYLTMILRAGFMIYVASQDFVKRQFSKIVFLLTISVVLLSILGIFQWIGQGSVFDNYLFFGEQPYGPATFDISKVNLFGRLKIPIYGTFRHPNIFAGFLSTVLIWIYYFIFSKKSHWMFKAAFLLGLISLVLTFSQAALISFALAVGFLFLIEKFGKKGVLISFTAVLGIALFGAFLFLINKDGIYYDPSFYRRAKLLEAAFSVIKENFIFGVGLNNFTVVLPNYLKLLLFNQPVHNVFVLIFAEAGVFGFTAYLILLTTTLFTLLKRSFGIPAILFVTILHFIILGSFDHYLYTIHQTQMMLWLTLGLSLAYTDIDEKSQT